ncbi:MAG: chromosome segregation protein SMC [bacterium]|nr:chromosome segregation protein SMC [bacterium]
MKIFGFKSFAKKEVFNFMPGITGIVGPNGCGKSNVVDAIRWVLGEQKAGILRSDRMENVIFNGSKSQKPLGMAEVSLVIQNTQNILPVEYSEVVITRRLFRSGESQYLLNNNPCRLKDINDLLMDTGLTPDAYSVIELSMVESILNGKPEDRRRIFEEAVGITKYKQRRKLTIRKLDATEQDMIRLADIIGEVRSKVNSLQRQVSRARRYQELSKSLQDLEIRLATHNYSKIFEELIPLNSKHEELTQKRESQTSQVSFKEAEVESFQANLVDLEQQLRDAQIQLNQLVNTIHKGEEEILLSRERLKSLADNKIRIQTEVEQFKQQIITHKNRSVKLQQERDGISNQIETIQLQYQQEKATFDALEKSLAKTRIESREIEKNAIEQMQSISEKQRTLERLNSQLEYIDKNRGSIADENESLHKRNEDDSKQLVPLKKNEETLQLQFDNLAETQAELELASEQLDQEIGQAKDDILKKTNQADALHQQAVFLKDLLESYADYPDGVKHLMLNYGSGQGFKATLADAISVADSYRAAIESALGEMAGYLFVKDNATAYVGVKNLEDNQQGIVTFIPIQNIAPKSKSLDVKNERGVIGWADELVTCDPDFLPAVKLLLGSYLLVEDFKTARGLAEKFANHAVHLITLAGEILFDWGGIKGGRKSAASESLVGRQGKLQQLKADAAHLNDEISNHEKRLKSLESQRAENIRSKLDVAQQLKNSREQLSQARLQISQLEYRITQQQERINSITAELARLNQQYETNSVQKQEIEKDLHETSAAYENINEQITGHQERIDTQDQDRNDQAAKVNQLNLKLVELTGNERNLVRELEQTRKSIDETEAAIKNRDQELFKFEDQKSQIEVRMEELSELLSNDYSLKETSEAKTNELELKEKTLRDAIDEKMKIVSQLRRERESNSELLHEIELRKSELRILGDNLYRRILEEYDLELQQTPIDPNFDIAADETTIDDLRQKIKSLGPVNLLALKEYEQEKTRLDFLEKQHEDLISAEQNLKDTINQLNKTAQEKFDNLFQEIRGNFIKVFQNFFPEGDADLLIVPDEDPLESAIEIKANPKGKRIESLTLLSGGEKSLTAISLLFAIYLVKPSPICILDEVDAPLDDNNVNRFINTIKQFSLSTQFIMVTHNKLTMKSADCLFGITMQESGVSKVVSVKLE